MIDREGEEKAYLELPVCAEVTIIPGRIVRSDDEYQDPGRRGRYAESLSLSCRPLKPSSVNAIVGGESGPARQHPQFFQGFLFLSLSLSLSLYACLSRFLDCELRESKVRISGFTIAE